MFNIKKSINRKISKDDIAYVEDLIVDGISETGEIEGSVVKAFSFNESKNINYRKEGDYCGN